MEVSVRAFQHSLRNRDWRYLFSIFARVVLLGGLLLFSFIVGLLPQRIHPDLMPMMVAGYVIIVLSIVSILKPMLLVYFIILSGATSTLVKDIGRMAAVGGTTMSTSGLRWGLIFVVAFVINLYYFRSRGIPRKYWIFALFLIYGAAVYLISGSSGTGDKDLIWYALPFVIGIFTHNLFLMVPLERVKTTDWLIRNSIWIIIGMFVYLFATGGLYMTKNGPDGVISARTVALFTSTLIAVPLARMRYHPSSAKRRQGLIYVLLFLSTVFITLSRMALGTAMLVVVMSLNRPRHYVRLVVGMLITGFLVIALFTAVPVLRKRTYRTGQLPTSFAQFVETFDSSGRFTRLWPLAIASGSESPIFGQGPGTARREVAEGMTAQKFQSEYPPHNEYLQVWHDFGWVGLTLLGAFYLYLLGMLWRRWKYYDDRRIYAQSYWSMAAFLSVFMMTFSAITANTFHYPFVMAVGFLIVGISDAMHERYVNEQVELESEDDSGAGVLQPNGLPAQVDGLKRR